MTENYNGSKMVIPIVTGRKNNNGEYYYFVKVYGTNELIKCDACKKEIKKMETFYVKIVYPYYHINSISINYCEECGDKTEEYINYMFEKIK